jgi:hypothetical protein
MMREPLRVLNGTSTGYGLGLITDRYRGVEVLFHAGGGMGGNSQMLKVPALGLDVVVLTNRGDVWAPLLADQVLDTCITGLDPLPEIKPGTMRGGVFRSAATGRVVHLFAKDDQQIASIDGQDLTVAADAGGVLWPCGIFRAEKQTFTLFGDDVNPSSIRLSDYGNPDELTLQVAVKSADVAPIVGHYRSNIAGLEAHISVSGEGAELSTQGPFGSAKFALTPLLEGVWRAQSANTLMLSGILSFPESQGSFRFSSGRTRALFFRRIA